MGSRFHSKGGILERFSEKVASKGGESPTTPKGLISAAVDEGKQALDSMNPALSEVSQRLQRLEQQVRQQLTGKTGSPSAIPGRETGRTALRDSLHALKEDVLSLAVNEVESQLLLQRLATLERAVSLNNMPGMPHEPKEAWNAQNQGRRIL
jgi:polysaccharide deacetylase 2 family uncharacterized protein YibQ